MSWSRLRMIVVLLVLAIGIAPAVGRAQAFTPASHVEDVGS